LGDYADMVLCMHMEPTQPLKDIVVIYHKHCGDGFGAAWAAWKKFGEEASYIPASYGDLIPEGIEGKEVYVVDFSYDEARLSDLESKAKRLVVIDHHKGGEAHVTARKEFVFNLAHSGAYLAWEYFHPEISVPVFLRYISESDIYSFTLPDAHIICVYLFTRPRTFADFDALYEEMEDESKRGLVIEKGKLLLGYRDILVEPALNSIHFIDLKGVIVPAVNVTLPLDEKSHLLHKVYELYPPVALSYRYDDGEWKCSLRSNGSFDCTELAGKFGGSGHPGSSGFAIKAEEGVFPFTIVENPNIQEGL